MMPNLDPSQAILESMRLGVDYRLPIQVRGFRVFVRPLSIAEKRMVGSLVVDEMMKLPDSAKNAMTEQTLFAQYELMYASTSAPDKLDFKLTETALKAMTVEELLALYRQYNGVCDKVNPMLESMDQSKVKELSESVKKNPSTLTELSLTELINVCRMFREESLTDK
jgi:hypothetical protein